MGVPLPDTGSVTEDTAVSGAGLLTASGDVDYFFGSDAGQWSAQTITGLYGSALSINTNGVWTYTATNSNSTIQALDTGSSITEVFTVTSTGGTTTITITINGQDEPPCFVAGTLIETDDGPRAVETLRAGDAVLTRDHRLQKLRWVGHRHFGSGAPTLKAVQPVRLCANCLAPGVPDRDVLVSPMHRVLVRNAVVELIAGKKEVFCPAHFLINGQSILREPVGEVTYFHLLFEQHEVVFASGCESESFYPGEVGLGSLDPAAQEALMAALAEIGLRPETYGETARPVLKQHEAVILQKFLRPQQKFMSRLTAEAA